MTSSFLLVSLNIEAILGEITLHQRRKKLDEMTKGKGLGDAYAATLSRMKAQQRSRSKLGMEVLMWISHSERPLHVDELCHALGVEEGSMNLNTRNIPAIETLLTCTLGLVAIEKPSCTVRLVHYTLQEYLTHNSNLFIKPHSMIAEACLTYLNFRQVREISPTVRSVPPTIPFVEYASCYWGTHAKRETTEGVKALALKLLDGYDKHISSKILLLCRMPDRDRPVDREGRPIGFTGLHGAAYIGCVEITVALLETKKWDVEATDLNGNTALAWAARKGREGVVRILLEWSGVNPNKPNILYYQAALSWAARNGHGGVVRILLGRNDVNPNTPDKYGQTPVLWAARNGREWVVRILLERGDVNPNTPDNLYRQTPLSFAAESGREGVVRILLERNDVNPNTPDKYGQTPVLWAARNGHEGVVRILLERSDVNPNTPDKYGQTPLSRGAWNGHEGVVRVLLEQNHVNPEGADDEYGQTPLSLAAQNGHEGVVRILLERDEVNSHMADKYGLTPLSWAARNGREGVVRILLGRNCVNLDTADRYGQTPLSWATLNGHESIVELLRNPEVFIP